MSTTEERAVGPYHRRRCLLVTGALGMVLFFIVTFALWGSVQTAKTARLQTESMAADALFSEVRATVALQQMHLRRYQIEPIAGSPAIDRHRQTAAATEDALAQLTAIATARSDALRLRGAHAEYRRHAERLIELVGSRNSGAVRFDQRAVQPSHLALQRDIDQVSRQQHLAAAAVVRAHEATQGRILEVTIAGSLLGLGLVVAIWRVIFCYECSLLAAARRSQDLAMQDCLTGLPNRACFEANLERIDSGPAAGHAEAAVIMIDLDGFKQVNDTFGHAAGDALLTEAGLRMRRVLRDDDVIARLGGDEFAVLIENAADHTQARDVARRIADELDRPFDLGTGPVSVSGSIGVAFGRADEAALLLRQADSAMYHAKGSGCAISVYEPGMDARPPARPRSLWRPRGAIRRLTTNGRLEGSTP
ncbi:diguanylate cyclase domain-containing protein [Catellatospora aurea]|uniref:Diguanylate cyclase domain-containing protein n=1 Tax=Catellatospora aurea TaxID=1337874 RepID=A0ABW2H5F6_9ACTN